MIQQASASSPAHAVTKYPFERTPFSSIRQIANLSTIVVFSSTILCANILSDLALSTCFEMFLSCSNSFKRTPEDNRSNTFCRCSGCFSERERDNCSIFPSARKSSLEIPPESISSTIGIISSRWLKSRYGDTKSYANLAALGVASQWQTPPLAENFSSWVFVGRFV